MFYYNEKMKRNLFEIPSNVLKHCPFCNGKGEFYVIDSNGDKTKKTWWFAIRCEKCLLKQPKIYKIEILFSKNGNIKLLTDERCKAIEDWNWRCNEE